MIHACDFLVNGVDFASTLLNRLGARWAADSVLLVQWVSKAI
jgi:hypothetical protein